MATTRTEIVYCLDGNDILSTCRADDIIMFSLPSYSAHGGHGFRIDFRVEHREAVRELYRALSLLAADQETADED